jgi:DNA-binding winged helix-turn-helix (wHTH) protein
VPRFDRQLLSTLPPQEPANQGLLLDDGGHVWVDGHPLNPPLSNLEFRLLEVLYRAAPEIVSQNDLIAAVWDTSWASEDALSSADETNLRKLVARLRRRLETRTTDSSRQFVRNAHGRGYWLTKP